MITAIFDMHNLAHRNYHKISGREGVAVDNQTLYGSIGSTVSRCLKELNSIVSPFATFRETTVRWLGAWDGGNDTWRHREYPDYKANRKPHPEGFDAKVAYCRAMFADGGKVPQYRVLGWEADDVIATLVRLARASDPDGVVAVVSNDKDLLQLLNDDRVALFDPANTSKQGQAPNIVNWWTAERVGRERGVAPSQIAALKAIQGDPTDNIPGVPGMGEKAARFLLQTFGDLDTAWAKGARRTTDREERRVAKNLTPENLETAKRWLRLTTLRDDVPGLDYAFRVTA